MLGVSPGSLVDSLANTAQVRDGRSGKSPVRHFDEKLIAKALVFMSTEMEDVTDEWSHVSVLVSHATGTHPIKLLTTQFIDFERMKG